MQWPTELELTLDTMAQGGDAIGRYEGRPVFASGGLPGELVRVQLDDQQRAFARGHVIEVIRAATDRVPSFCPLERICGAADWRWIDYNAQRRFKVQILRDQLRHLGSLDVDVRPPTPDPPPTTGYRTTATLHVAGTSIGYFLPGSRNVADLPGCCLHHPLINEAIATLQPLLDPDLPLRDVTLRCSPETGAVLAVINGPRRAGTNALRPLARRWRQAFPALVGVSHGRGALLDGQNWLARQVSGTRFHLSATSFFQINAFQTAPLVERVRHLIDVRSTDRVLDLYCGVGLFALSLAPLAREIVGIEEWSAAIEDARRSADLNAIRNVRFQIGTAEDTLAKVASPIDRVVLDPPRRGCAPAALDALIRLEPGRIVYVSCHPGTLARDCKALASAGYRITSAETIDMFPHTHHVESIVRLDRT